MTAPERIWATPFDIKSDGGTYCDAESRPSAPNKDAWCYRRADLPPTLAQALAVPEIAALVEARRKQLDAHAEYTSALAKVREYREHSLHFGNVDAEFARMTEAKSTFIRAAQDFADKSLAALKGGAA
jgi:hypothetical protein